MGSGGVAIAALPTVICLKVPFSDGLGGGYRNHSGCRLSAYCRFDRPSRHAVGVHPSLALKMR